MRRAGTDSRTTDERPWTTPRRGRPDARPWHGPLPVYLLLVRRGRAVPVNRGTCRGIRLRNFRPQDIPHSVRRRNFRRRDNLVRNALLWQPPRRTPQNVPSWREPLPACRPRGRHEPAGLVVRDNILAPRDIPEAHTPAEPALTARCTIGRAERTNRFSRILR